MDRPALTAVVKQGLTPSVSGVLAGTRRPGFADSEELPRDSVMEVVGPRLQSGLVNVVRGLAEEKLTQFADRVQTRILQSTVVTEEERTQWAAKQKQKYKTFVESDSSFYEEFLHVSEAWICGHDEGGDAVPMRSCHEFGVDIVNCFSKFL
ncbi:TPA: hypothetical protein ACH3X1_016343 [Trebouxia sp. C0004]